ncbi:lipocalin family protein [Mucilaginibacter sp.]|uniref:lipocalin family protein n=1 Tax=Mucilaginibacter sp. TaxID=1882438 RepID=UPI003D11BCEC
MKKEKLLIALAAGAGIAAIAYTLLSLTNDIPDGAVPVQPFNKNRYMGTWNEIARLPNRIEKNIKHLTEKYSLNNDGTIKVVTKGYNVKNNSWKELSGKIKFVESENVGMLKASYFGPFYSAYNILALDPDYKYALVSGSGLDYLWILSRDTFIPDEIKEEFLNTAKNIGFAVDQLEWV